MHRSLSATRAKSNRRRECRSPDVEPDCIFFEASHAGVETFVENALVDGVPRAAIASVITRTDRSDDIEIDDLDPSEIAPVAAARFVVAIDALAELVAFPAGRGP